jgi:hypothetical protein
MATSSSTYAMRYPSRARGGQQRVGSPLVPVFLLIVSSSRDCCTADHIREVLRPGEPVSASTKRESGQQVQVDLGAMLTLTV